MTEQNRIDRLLVTPVSRREVLTTGAIASVGAFLAACQAGTTASPSPTASSAPSTGASVGPSPSPAEDWAGTTLRVWTTLTPETLVKNAKASWEPRTGGKVEITTLDFGDVPIKYAGVIASQDATVDVLYTYAGFMGQFGERIYDDIGPLAGDTSAWLPSTLAIMSPAGVLRALPVHSETEIFIYNKEMFEAAGFEQFHTDEHEIAYHAANLFMARIGARVPPARRAAFTSRLVRGHRPMA